MARIYSFFLCDNVAKQMAFINKQKHFSNDCSQQVASYVSQMQLLAVWKKWNVFVTYKIHYRDTLIELFWCIKIKGASKNMDGNFVYTQSMNPDFAVICEESLLHWENAT